MCETVREKWLNKIPIILLLFSDFQATWSDGRQIGSMIERHCLRIFIVVGLQLEMEETVLSFYFIFIFGTRGLMEWVLCGNILNALK